MSTLMQDWTRLVADLSCIGCCAPESHSKIEAAAACPVRT